MLHKDIFHLESGWPDGSQLGATGFKRQADPGQTLPN